MFKNFKSFLSVRENRNHFLFSLIIVITSLIVLNSFLRFNELRDGFRFSDPLLILFKPIDVSLEVFLLIYGSLIYALFSFINRPKLLVMFFYSYSILIITRMIAMYLLPLEPPADIIPLVDPFVEFFGSGEVLKKDLFFSGHTSILFLIYLIFPSSFQKKYFLLCSILVGVLVLLQHVHYSIDVFAAFIFAFTCNEFVKKIKDNLK